MHWDMLSLLSLDITPGLSVRRCVSCYSTTCVSSFCKEELLLSLLTLPTATAHLLLYIPVLDANLVTVRALLT
mgnify:CR=1 FL=1